ncbi:Mss4-like protein [Boeremia exigua]|uniref:Mss4-like protein n=1 Tax=Boeremia exigua TaxID=749465 RepID=UPI001E8C9E3D|nr:Mss4-like protein [Boeremia exigua]KAH6642135.1 Mss4-like protein [Boeremia exigua]
MPERGTRFLRTTDAIQWSRVGCTLNSHWAARVVVARSHAASQPQNTGSRLASCVASLNVAYLLPTDLSAMTYINPRDSRVSSPDLTPTEPLIFTGGCHCKKVTYTVRLACKSEARTTICHCESCKKTFGGVFGVTVKIPLTGLKMTDGKTVVYKSDNGSGTYSYREFCNECGSTICTYEEQAKGHFRLMALGSLDDPAAFEPTGEFYCSQREVWLPEVPGKSQFWKR